MNMSGGLINRVRRLGCLLQRARLKHALATVRADALVFRLPAFGGSFEVSARGPAALRFGVGPTNAMSSQCWEIHLIPSGMPLMWGRTSDFSRFF